MIFETDSLTSFLVNRVPFYDKQILRDIIPGVGHEYTNIEKQIQLLERVGIIQFYAPYYFDHIKPTYWKIYSDSCWDEVLVKPKPNRKPWKSFPFLPNLKR